MERHQAHRDDTRSIYERIARLAIENLELASLTALRTYRGIIGCVHPSTFEGPDLELVSHALILEFISDLIALGLEEHQDLLAQKICDHAGRVEVEEFLTLWIPLLKELLGQLEGSLPVPRWTQVYQGLLQAFLRNCVGVMPAKPTYSRQGVRCSCGDCAELNRFLVDPARGVEHFKIAERRRVHLENELSSARVDCANKVTRFGIPHTLVVVKTTKQHTAAVKDWRERFRNAKAQLQGFNQEMLRLVLEDQFDEIISMKGLKRRRPARRNTRIAGGSSRSNNSNAPPRLATTTPHPTAGTKRKHIETIDLTGND